MLIRILASESRHSYAVSTLPVTVSGFKISDNNYGGIYIEDASPLITNCTFTNNFSNTGGGVRIVGESHPRFYNCTFSDNSSSSGGAVAISGNGMAAPTGMFSYCIFNNNKAQGGSGGAIWIEYNTDLDTTKTQPSFFGCEFISNEAAVEGSAIWLQKCHRPYFSKFHT